jgi:hypothetical protein
MAIRVFVAGIVGGILLFVWGYVSHGVLSIGKDALKGMPAHVEEQVLAGTRGQLTEEGMYFFPGWETSMDNMTDAQWEAWSAKVTAGPRGFLIYHPDGAEPMSPKMLGTEFATNLAAALLAAMVAAGLRAGYGGRVLAIMAFGIVAWLSVSCSNWIWHAFPTEVLKVDAIDVIGGWLLAGIGMSGLLGRRALKSA